VLAIPCDAMPAASSRDQLNIMCIIGTSQKRGSGAARAGMSRLTEVDESHSSWRTTWRREAHSPQTWVHGIDRSRASHAQQSDQLKYFMDHVPATFVLARINVENCGFFNGHRGEQLARRFTALKASPSDYSTIPQRQEWALLIEGFERALRLHAHKPGSLLPLADYLYGRTGGYIVSRPT
jgi:hypothetical protein